MHLRVAALAVDPADCEELGTCETLVLLIGTAFVWIVAAAAAAAAVRDICPGCTQLPTSVLGWTLVKNGFSCIVVCIVVSRCCVSAASVDAPSSGFDMLLGWNLLA
jgi:hypothetical protein